MRNTGRVYAAIGMELSHTSPPSCYYTRDYSKMEHRVAYQRHKLAEKLEIYNPEQSVWENMKANGFDRWWDCGTDVWIIK